MQTDKLNVLLEQRNNVVLALFIVTILVVIVLPLPTILVDLLLTVSIATAVILCMIAIYVPSALSFSAFPAVLLLTTLFRLGLSISTTRLILLQADAGEIVTAFGNFVVGGNLIVGLVIFLIITVVQFVVITKGSERVAEVSARFSLDALPGQQMSIDADVRAGTITSAVAVERRARLQKESQLFGSMDGAMKFVKGDAIAGIVITMINLLGGISIGMLQQDMEFGHATSVYSILTIGDGLVAQLPALLIALSAGILVTRVDDDKKAGLGQDIGTQIMAHPMALLVGSGLLLAFAAIPGFPSGAFILVSIAVGGLGFTLWKAENTAPMMMPSIIASPGVEQPTATPDTGSPPEDEAGSKPLTLELHPALGNRLNPEALNAGFDKERIQVSKDLGVPLPPVHVRYVDEFEEEAYRLCIHDVPVCDGYLREGHLLALADEARVRSLGLEYREPGTITQQPCVWVPASGQATLDQAEVRHLDAHQTLIHQIAWAVRHNAAELIGVQETKALLDTLSREAADLVREVIGTVTLAIITEVLKRLLRDNVPIRNLRLVLEDLLDRGPKIQDAAVLAEFARERLKRQISHRFCSPDNTMHVIMLDTEIENAVREASGEAFGDNIPLAPEMRVSLARQVRAIQSEQQDNGIQPVVKVKQDIRRFVRFVLLSQSVDIPVLAFQEIIRELDVRVVGKVTMPAFHENDQDA